MNARTRTCEQQQLNALRMLAACPHGATALALLVRGFGYVLRRGSVR
jgi:hypothetical protein